MGESIDAESTAGGRWTFDDSSSESSSSSSSSVTLAHGRGRGRGRGRRPRGRPRRVPVFARAPSPPDAAAPASAAGALAVASMPLSSWIRPLGGPSCELVARLLEGPAAEKPPEEVNYFLGDEAPPVNIGRCADVLKMPPRTFKRRLQTLASAVFFGSRALAASLIFMFRRKMVQPASCRVVGIFRSVAYDETPMKCRVARQDADNQGPETAKLMQAECQFMVLYQNLPVLEPDKGAFDCMVLNLPCPVQVADRGTGEVLQAAIDKVSEVPGLSHFRAENPAAFSTDVSHCDRAKSNSRAEDGLFARHGIPRLRMPCVAHMASTAQGRGFAVVADDLTGIISLSLSQSSASGQALEFQHHIRDVLFESIVRIHHHPPLPDTHPRSQQLLQFLHHCLPGTDAGKKRADALHTLLLRSSDMWSVEITLQCAPGTDDRWVWAKQVAKLLLPSMIRVFPRHRWVHSFNDVRAYALLGINNVLQRGGLRWLAGKAPVPMAVVAKPPVPLQDVVSEAVVPWTFSDDEEDPAARAVVPAAGSAAASLAESQGNVWAQFNKNQKQKAIRYLRSDPRDRLHALLFCMRVGVGMLRSVLHIASDAWQVDAWRRTMNGQCTNRTLFYYKMCANVKFSAHAMRFA